ncbi:MAG: hypothetical protein MI922_18480 [Bacteroidales bacterium]|nr:hypothetical protein [Bacteroidales bacterium]
MQTIKLNTKQKRSRAIAHSSKKSTDYQQFKSNIEDKRKTFSFTDNRNGIQLIKGIHNNSCLSQKKDSVIGIPIQMIPKGISLPGNLEKEEVLQFSKLNNVLQKVSIDLTEWGEKNIWTHNERNTDKIIRYLKYLYRNGKHDEIWTIYNAIEEGSDGNRDEWLDHIENMMKYGGLNKSVRAVANSPEDSEDKNNYAQATMILFNDLGGEIYRIATEIYKSGTSEPDHRSHESKEMQVSKRDSEVGIVDDLISVPKRILKRAANIEIHLVSLNGPCNGCKSRLVSLAKAISRMSARRVVDEDDFISKTPTKAKVSMRVYYLVKAYNTSRHGEGTTYGWSRDKQSEQGVYTHDIKG